MVYACGSVSIKFKDNFCTSYKRTKLIFLTYFLFNMFKFELISFISFYFFCTRGVYTHVTRIICFKYTNSVHIHIHAKMNNYFLDYHFIIFLNIGRHNCRIVFINKFTIWGNNVLNEWRQQIVRNSTPSLSRKKYVYMCTTWMKKMIMNKKTNNRC